MNYASHLTSRLVPISPFFLQEIYRLLTCTAKLEWGWCESGLVPLYQVILAAGLAPLTRQRSVTMVPSRTGESYPETCQDAGRTEINYKRLSPLHLSNPLSDVAKRRASVPPGKRISKAHAPNRKKNLNILEGNFFFKMMRFMQITGKNLLPDFLLLSLYGFRWLRQFIHHLPIYEIFFFNLLPLDKKEVAQILKKA